MNKIKTPKSLNELTLKMIEPLGDVYDTDVTNFRLKEIAVLVGMEYNDVYKLPLETANDLLKKLEWFYKLDPKDIQPVYEFEHNGIQYTLMKEINELVMGQWVDLDAYMNNIKNHWTLTKHIIALCSQIKGVEHSYPNNGKELEKRLKVIEELPLNIVFGYTGFFLTKRLQWKELSHQYLILNSLNQNMDINTQTITKNGGGLKSWLVNCAMEIFLNMMVCVGWVYMNVLPFFQLQMKKLKSKLKSITSLMKNIKRNKDDYTRL